MLVQIGGALVPLQERLAAIEKKMRHLTTIITSTVDPPLSLIQRLREAEVDRTEAAADVAILQGRQHDLLHEAVPRLARDIAGLGMIPQTNLPLARLRVREHISRYIREDRRLSHR